MRAVMTSPTNSLGHILMGEHIHLFAPVETKTNRLWGQRFERAKKTHSKQEIPQPRMLTFPLIHSLPPGISKVARSFKFQQTEKWSLPNRGIGGYEPGRLLSHVKAGCFLGWAGEGECGEVVLIFFFLDVLRVGSCCFSRKFELPPNAGVY